VLTSRELKLSPLSLVFKKVKTARIVLSVLLGLFIFILTIMEINPVDTSLADKLKDLEARIDATQKTRQPYLGDWYEFNTSLFTYVSDNIVDVDDSIVLLDVFQIGDKVRVTQDGGYKYFYIIKLTTATNQITLNGGTDYTFDNSTFSTFGISKLVSPAGFPTAFNFASNANFSGGSGVSITTNVATYSMQGSVLFLSYRISWSYSSAPTGLDVDLPFTQGDTGMIQGYIGATSVNPIYGLLVSNTDFLQFTLGSYVTGIFMFSQSVGYIMPD